MAAESRSPNMGKEMPVSSAAMTKTDDRDGNNDNGVHDNGLKRSSSNANLKRLIRKIMRSSSMKNLFKSKKPKAPADVVKQTKALLLYLDSDADLGKIRREDKLEQFDAHIREMKLILYGDECEPSKEACAQLTQEFFREDTMRLLIKCLPKVNFEARIYATQVVANLQHQTVRSRLIASDYMEANLDLVDQLIIGYGDPSLALQYGGMLRECIRHQVVARYVLSSDHMTKFFDYIQLPSFDVASDAQKTFKELMTRHKSTIGQFLTENYDWFFADFNSKLLESTNYMTRRNAITLLGEVLLDRSNAGVMIRYVTSATNMRVLMNLLRDSTKSIQINTFHVFKLFVANQHKPPEIVRILSGNRTKLLRLLRELKLEKEDEVFEADKGQVIKVIEALDPVTPSCSGELFKAVPV